MFTLFFYIKGLSAREQLLFFKTNLLLIQREVKSQNQYIKKNYVAFP